MVLPASPTRRVPASTLSTLVPIRPLISLAASALRCARLRTSPATTAKPRPCSPARAASTAALSARMLVWKAMPSITPMMSAIFLELWLISSMVLTTWPTTWPPRAATSALATAIWLAWRAASALWRRCRSSLPCWQRSPAGCWPPARCAPTGRCCRWQFRCWPPRCAGSSSAPKPPPPACGQSVFFRASACFSRTSMCRTSRAMPSGWSTAATRLASSAPSRAVRPMPTASTTSSPVCTTT
jgi:hypothetical protein